MSSFFLSDFLDCSTKRVILVPFLSHYKWDKKKRRASFLGNVGGLLYFPVNKPPPRTIVITPTPIFYRIAGDGFLPRFVPTKKSEPDCHTTGATRNAFSNNAGRESWTLRYC